MTVQLPRLAVLGSGELGASVIEGLHRAGIGFADGWAATTGTAAGLARIPAIRGLERFSVEGDPQANARAARGARLVLVAVRPQQVESVIADIAHAVNDTAMVISLCASPGLQRLRELLGEGPALARMMPNTAVRLLAGVIGVSFEDGTDASARELVGRMCAALGQVFELDESRLDVLTGVLGAQAQLYEFTDAVREAIIAEGFDVAEATALARQLLVGAASMSVDRGDAADGLVRLRDGLATPGGTTEKGLAVLRAAGLRPLVRRAVKASVRAAAAEHPTITHE